MKAAMTCSLCDYRGSWYYIVCTVHCLAGLVLWVWRRFCNLCAVSLSRHYSLGSFSKIRRASSGCWWPCACSSLSSCGLGLKSGGVPSSLLADIDCGIGAAIYFETCSFLNSPQIVLRLVLANHSGCDPL